VKLFSKYYDVFNHDTSASWTHFVNFATFTVTMTLNLSYRLSEVRDLATNQLDLNRTLVLSCHVSEMPKASFYTPSLLQRKFWVFPLK